MAIRTYVVGLRLALEAINRYGNRWQPQLSQSLTTQQYQCLLAVLTAVQECLKALGPKPFGP